MSIQFSVNSITVWYLCDLIIGGWIEDDQNDFIVKKIKAFIYSPYLRIIYLSIYLSVYLSIHLSIYLSITVFLLSIFNGLGWLKIYSINRILFLYLMILSAVNYINKIQQKWRQAGFADYWWHCMCTCGEGYQCCCSRLQKVAVGQPSAVTEEPSL